MEDKDEVTGKVKLWPSIQGQFRFKLAGYFDVVLYHECGEKGGEQVYWTQCQGDERIAARSRLDSLAKLNKFEKNSYEIINNLIGG
jgi:hypothetical protein